MCIVLLKCLYSNIVLFWNSCFLIFLIDHLFSRNTEKPIDKGEGDGIIGELSKEWVLRKGKRKAGLGAERKERTGST